MKQITFEINIPHVPAMFTSLFPRGVNEEWQVHRCHFGLYDTREPYTLEGYNIMDFIVKRLR